MRPVFWKIRCAGRLNVLAAVNPSSGPTQPSPTAASTAEISPEESTP